MHTPEPFVSLYDTTATLWETPDRPGCSTEYCRALTRRAFTPLIRMMRSRGWRVTADPDILKHHRALRRYRRRATKGDLIATLESAGRTVKVEIWQERHGITHPNGGRYEFRKRRLMPPALRRLCDLELDKIAACLAAIAQPHAASILDCRRLDEQTADEKIARAYRESSHTVAALGRPRFCNACDNRSGDGAALEQGQTVWSRSSTGRWERGQAFYRLNQTWMVRHSHTSLAFRFAHELYTRPPADPREKVSPRRGTRLAALLTAAVAAENFIRAQRLKTIRDAQTAPIQRAS